MTDLGLLGAIVGEVALGAPTGTHVVFVTQTSPSSRDREAAIDLSERAKLQASQWSLVDVGGLAASLTGLAGSDSPGAVVVAIDGASVSVPDLADDFDVAVVEVS